MTDDGLITAPLSIGEVKTVLAESTNDLGKLCTSNKINIWSKNKPVRFNKIAPLSTADYQNVRYGLKDSSSSYLNLYNYMPTDFARDRDGYVKLAYKPIEMLRPRGGSYNEPYRLTDFNGYYHKAVSPFKISLSGDNLPMYCFIQPAYRSSDGITNAIFDNFQNTIQVTTNPLNVDRDYNITWNDLMTSGGQENYNIAILLINADATGTGSTLVRGSDYIVLSSGIKLGWLINGDLHRNSAQGFEAITTGGFMTLKFDYQALNNFLNGKRNIYSKVVLVTSNFGFNNNTASITSCYSLDFDDSFTGIVLPVKTLPSIIEHTMYIYSSTVANVYKYYGNSISQFDTNTYDYYRLTTAYASGYSYNNETNHLLAGNNLVAITYESKAAPIGVSYNTISPQASIECSAANGTVLIKRSGNTFTINTSSKYIPNTSGIRIDPNKSTGSGNYQSMSISKNSDDASVNEIWIRTYKNKIPTITIIVEGQVAFNCNIIS